MSVITDNFSQQFPCQTFEGSVCESSRIGCKTLWVFAALIEEQLQKILSAGNFNVRICNYICKSNKKVRMKQKTIWFFFTARYWYTQYFGKLYNVRIRSTTSRGFKLCIFLLLISFHKNSQLLLWIAWNNYTELISLIFRNKQMRNLSSMVVEKEISNRINFFFFYLLKLNECYYCKVLF